MAMNWSQKLLLSLQIFKGAIGDFFVLKHVWGRLIHISLVSAAFMRR